MHASQSDSAQQFAEIPRRIFQTWKVRSPLPAAFEFWSSTIKEHNKDYEYIIWDDADNKRFIAENYPWFMEKYEFYTKEIFRVDAVRYFELYHFGGFYLDLDVECLRPLDRYLTGNDVLVGRMGQDAAFPDLIPNAIMASKPRQEFWLDVISRLLAGPASGDVEAVTGPKFLKVCVDDWNEEAPNRRSGTEAVRERLRPDLAVTDANSPNNDFAAERVVSAQLERSRPSGVSEPMAEPGRAVAGGQEPVRGRVDADYLLVA